ncbi:MAG: ribosomal protein [Rickettsiaceae bacterium]|nr:ribosomal protein [Rickettsiaceae bacterium]
MIERDKSRKHLSKKFAKKRAALKKVVMDKTITLEQRFEAQLALNDLPRDSSQSRYRNRCAVTGRPRGYYRKFKLSRITLRDLAAVGQIPGLTKSSW